MNIHTATAAPVPGQNCQGDGRQVSCTSCSYSVPAWALFCARCGAFLACPSPSLSTGQEEGIRGRNETHIFVLTLLGRRDATRPFDLSNGTSLGSFSISSTGVTRAGSHARDEIILDDVSVSKHHAQFVGRGSHCLVRDLDSVNGTFVNGVRVESIDLSSGDSIQIGRFRLLYFEFPANGSRPRTPTMSASAA